jgi:ABC-type phosphate transport system substrate-binding protein
MPSRKIAPLAAPLIAAALALVASPARAIECKDAGPSPVYGQGGSAHKPLIARIASALAATGTPLTVVYAAPGACVGINSLLNNTPITGTASYWTAAGKEETCDLPLTGQVISFANMGNQASGCAGVTLPADVADILGPVGSVNFIVPLASSQQSISAEAAYFAYGFGRTGDAAPWTDESVLIKRNQDAFVTQFVHLAIGVPPNAFKGQDAGSNQNTVTLVAGAPNPEGALGYVSGNVADANTKTVRTLAYQHFGQLCGYWPDSTASAFDKRNVRSGQYHLWGPTHFFARADSTTKVVTDPKTRELLGLFSGETPPPAGVDLLDLFVKAGSIPRCAMNAWRDTDLGPTYSYQHPEPCGCYFESLTPGGTICTPCPNGNSDCPASAPVCRHKFCEVR